MHVSRIAIVGEAYEVDRFKAWYQLRNLGIEIVASVICRSDETMMEDLLLAAIPLGRLDLDAVYVLPSRRSSNIVNIASSAFETASLSLHIGMQTLLDQFPNATVNRIGGITSLKLVERPLSITDALIKRVCDLLVSSILILLLSPLLILTAVALKVAKRGPIFSKLRCYGFNQHPFSLLSFDVGDTDRASCIEHLPTRIYRAIYRMRLKQLPVLFNILLGQMSFIGPRPQSLAQNQREERLFSLHPRRHNVRPGVFGWARLHGLHEQPCSVSKLEARIEHDLYYVDHRTSSLDAKIIKSMLFRATPLYFVPRLQTVTKVDPLPICDRCFVLRVRIDNFSKSDVLAVMQQCLEGLQECKTIFIVNAHTINVASTYPNYRDVLNSSDYTLADGVGMHLATKMSGYKLLDNLNGTDLIPALLRSTAGYRCYLLGGELAIVKRAAAVIAEQYPGWTVCGYHHGFIDETGSRSVIEKIKICRPDLILVGMGNPYQECWITENRSLFPSCLVVGVGALFSYLSGDCRRAPSYLRKMRLEWLFVLSSQRHKWRRYIFGIPTFLAHIFADRIAQLLYRQP